MSTAGDVARMLVAADAIVMMAIDARLVRAPAPMSTPLH